MNKINLIILLVLIQFTINAQSPIGTWVTIDDETGKAKSQVEVFEKNGKIYGKIVKLILKPQNAVCESCGGNRKNKPLVGMVILYDFIKSGNEWISGKIYKADSGKEYGGSLKMDGADKLIVTGKVLFISRSQTWTRVK